MVKAFAFVGLIAALSFSQGCGGKKDVAATPTPAPSQPAASSQSGSSGDGGGSSSSSNGPGAATSMALPGGPNSGGEVNSGGGDSTFNNSAVASGSNEGDGYTPPGISISGGGGVPQKGRANFGNDVASNSPQTGFGFANQTRTMPKVAPPPTLKDQAVNAFQSGNPKRAYAYLQAHALNVPDEEAAETLKNYRWASHRKRPQLGLNIAVGVALKNPQNATDLSPLGSQPKNGGGGRDSGPASMGMGMGMGGPAANTGKPKTLAETTGIFGTQLVAAFKEKHESGAWSPAFSEYSLGTTRVNGFGAMAGGNNAGGFDGGAGNPGGLSNQFGSNENGGSPTGYPSGGAQSGQPTGYPSGGASGPPTGYPSGGASGPPAGYPSGGASGPPAGYPSGGASGPPAGYPSGGASGPPAGYPSGGASGPPAGYPSGGAQSGAPAGYPSGSPNFGGSGDNSGGPQGAEVNSGGGTSSPLRFQGKGGLGMPSLGGPGMGPGAGDPDSAGPGLSGPGMIQGPGMPGPDFGPGGGGPVTFGPGGGPGMPGPDFGPGGGGPVTFGPGGGPGMGGPGMRGNASMLGTDSKLPPGSSPLAPCLTYIGVDEASKLMKKAWQEGYDGLMLFEVTIGVNRAYQWVLNDTMVRVVQPNAVPKDVKRIYVSKSFNNIQFAKTKAKGEPDGLSEAIDKIIKETEVGLALQSFPSALTPDIIATKRIPALLKDNDLSVLDRLSEVNLYYYKGFIDEIRKADAFEQIAGQAGRVIATGSPTERLEAIEKLLEREFK